MTGEDFHQLHEIFSPRQLWSLFITTVKLQPRLQSALCLVVLYISVRYDHYAVKNVTDDGCLLLYYDNVLVKWGIFFHE